MATTKITSPDLFDLGSLNTALKLPSGTTAERPTSPSTGEWRYNTTTNLVEFWDGGEWRDLQSEDIPPTPSENFNTVIYTGNGGTQSITGVGFKPDFVWIKNREGTTYHNILDTTRGATKYLAANATSAEETTSDSLTSFDSDGFTLGAGNGFNNNGIDFVAWCWKANGGTTSSNTDGTQTSTVQVNAKAGFSIVQYTASAAGASETVGHGLGTTPAMIILKRTDAVEDWYVWHKDLGAGGSALNQFLKLNSTSPQATATNLFKTVNSTVFNPSYTSSVPNTNIAYCFSEKAEYSKFGSYIGNGSTNGPVINTGFEPAYIMIKNSTSTYEWTVYDNKRSTSNPRNNVLYPNTDGTENSGETGDIDFLTNGFQPKAPNGTINHNGGTLIYAAFAADASSAAPTLANSFANKLYTGTNAAQSITGLGFSPSFIWFKNRTGTNSHALFDSVRGNLSSIYSDLTSAANISSAGEDLTSFDSDGFSVGTVANAGSTNVSGGSIVAWNWKANPIPTINTDGTIQSIAAANSNSGFSIVKYTGNGVNGSTVGHSLGVAPEVMIIKSLSSALYWAVYSKYNTGSSGNPATERLRLNDSGTTSTTTVYWDSTEPGSSVFTIGTDTDVNTNNDEFIAYCFTSISGFSKMGSYSGTGSAGNAQDVGFTPAWVMIKRTSSISDWYMFDTARGDTSVLLANTSAAQFTNTNFNLTSTGFDFDGTDFNEAGSSWIYMAFKDNYEYASTGTMAFMLIAGGGGGGVSTGTNTGITYVGCGGGAGGFRGSGKVTGGGCSPQTDISLAAGTYTVTIGAGGSPGVSGSTSSIAGPSLTTITTTGGGRGASSAYQPEGGGSAGGRSTHASANQSAVACEGFPALEGSQVSWQAGGGGAGGAQTSIGNSNASGIGVESAMTGAATYYAGGGAPGGFNTTSRPQPQAGGGGQGQLMGETAVDTPSIITGTINTGAGGGGGSNDSNTGAKGGGGSGGSGFAVLRLKTAEYSGTTTGSPTVTTSGDETIIQFTGSGTYVHS